MTAIKAAREDSLGPPVPPFEFPPGQTTVLPGRGEFFYRDSGGEGPAVLLLHGWVVSADLNWLNVYQPLQDAGFRVIAIDHRGHGRGPRPNDPFRLTDCAADAAALIEHLNVGPAIVAGYSMGGPISELLARSRPELVAALILCATAPSWDDAHMKRTWKRMWAMALTLGLFPHAFWRWGAEFTGTPKGPETSWTVAELARGSARDLAEAGRELGRYDARSWLGELDMPVAVVVTTRDRSVPPRRQRELAELTGAKVFEAECDHLGAGAAPHKFEPAFSRAVQHIAQQVAIKSTNESVA
jgi:pimeloyl-ACP methyl ester carboxylesterase